MIVVPALDIRGGRAVRLLQGDFDAETVYSHDPLEAARGWVAQGAAMLHVVDLDGARSGEPCALSQLERIAGLDVPVQYGGGLRSLAALRSALSAGAARVVLGTAACTDDELVMAAIGEWPDRVVVAVDSRDGRVAISGWRESTGATAEELVARLTDAGVRHFVYTQIDRDGTLEGPDLAGLEAIARGVEGELLYSGGVGSLDDLRALASVRAPALGGVIVGKALYEGRFDVGEAQAALAGDGATPARR